MRILATITKLRKWGQAWKHSAESAQNAASRLTAEHERKLAEHRASFGARTSADAKIIEGLRKEIGVARMAVLERDGLLTQVQDQRAEIERLRNDERKAYQDGEAMRVERDALLRVSIARGDFAEIKVAQLKSQSTPTPKQHPAKVGEWVKKTTDGLMYKIGEKFRLKSYEIKDGQIWCNLDNGASWLMSVCEPCDPPVDHDTPAGKEAAEAVIRNSQMTEIKVGDVVEVVSASGGQTWMADVGSTGKVRLFELIDSIECVRLQNLPGKRNALGGYVSLCDVRKVPQ